MTREVRCVAPEAVMNEVEAVAVAHPSVAHASYDDWLERVRVDGLPELRALARYVQVLGAGDRDPGRGDVPGVGRSASGRGGHR